MYISTKLNIERFQKIIHVYQNLVSKTSQDVYKMALEHNIHLIEIHKLCIHVKYYGTNNSNYNKNVLSVQPIINAIVLHMENVYRRVDTYKKNRLENSLHPQLHPLALLKHTMNYRIFELSPFSIEDGDIVKVLHKKYDILLQNRSSIDLVSTIVNMMELMKESFLYSDRDIINTIHIYKDPINKKRISVTMVLNSPISVKGSTAETLQRTYAFYYIWMMFINTLTINGFLYIQTYFGLIHYMSRVHTYCIEGNKIVGMARCDIVEKTKKRNAYLYLKQFRAYIEGIGIGSHMLNALKEIQHAKNLEFFISMATKPSFYSKYNFTHYDAIYKNDHSDDDSDSDGEYNGGNDDDFDKDTMIEYPRRPRTRQSKRKSFTMNHNVEIKRFKKLKPYRKLPWERGMTRNLNAVMMSTERLLCTMRRSLKQV